MSQQNGSICKGTCHKSLLILNPIPRTERTHSCTLSYDLQTHFSVCTRTYIITINLESFHTQSPPQKTKVQMKRSHSFRSHWSHALAIGLIKPGLCAHTKTTTSRKVACIPATLQTIDKCLIRSLSCIKINKTD